MPVKENVLTRTDDFIKWFLPKIEKFPRNYKFLFGDRLVEIQFDVLENLIEAYYRKEKIANLRAANIGVEKLLHLLQISTEMRLLSFDQLEYATRSLNQIGSMTSPSASCVSVTLPSSMVPSYSLSRLMRYCEMLVALPTR